MPESVPVRCPVCRRAHVYTAPAYPCVCGAPVTPRLDPAAEPVVAEHRAWDDEWLTVVCADCGRPGHWPCPELGCPCGTVLRVPVARQRDGDSGAEGPGRQTAAPPDPLPARAADRSPADDDADDMENPGGASIPGAGTDRPGDTSGPGDRTREPGGTPGPCGGSGRPGGTSGPGGHRAPFQPRTIRTARDAVTTAALYLRWLGYRDIRRADQRPPHGIGLAARGLLAQIDPSVRPAAPRDVECLWLTAMTESARCVHFSLAGYTEAGRCAADALGIPLFVLDLTGVPQPVNDAAGTLHATGAPDPGTRTRDGRA
ncbi:hypothetical protein JK361_02900 [Streptomyces sp. 5-8]|uniref:Restriction endonuclease n=1 Tax=Streptomyces musisoli TaxID=2802280 RepID=A0ABS1NUG6_9ACTN|nr:MULTISPECIES: hypothetical protein [Streptomyces]MBL1103560.1 hypothetical protein [Streptomyces musisoli]MBY8839834.1 hypothetical protein [Streptomyces sp. SP2-10]